VAPAVFNYITDRAAQWLALPLKAVVVVVVVVMMMIIVMTINGGISSASVAQDWALATV
jgi:hypothetical protein